MSLEIVLERTSMFKCSNVVSFACSTITVYVRTTILVCRYCTCSGEEEKGRERERERERGIVYMYIIFTIIQISREGDWNSRLLLTTFHHTN